MLRALLHYLAPCRTAACSFCVDSPRARGEPCYLKESSGPMFELCPEVRPELLLQPPAWERPGWSGWSRLIGSLCTASISQMASVFVTIPRCKCPSLAAHPQSCRGQLTLRVGGGSRRYLPTHNHNEMRTRAQVATLALLAGPTGLDMGRRGFDGSGERQSTGTQGSCMILQMGGPARWKHGEQCRALRERRV